MIILDTNVLSEALMPVPSEVVLNWLALQQTSLVFITTITQAEILYGIEILPAGKRRSRLQSAVEDLLINEFQGRIIPFDDASAQVYPKVVAGRDSIGRPISQFDAMIASICRSRRAAVATRNVRDFQACGIPIINPWQDSQPS